ncbi:hypothetical protein [Streptomyces sp. NBC_01012]|uniref:hypothetical protein n=1 Tax=Streptomyces sp. NBC_01012 TaxID=2903717 RepID=UPI0038643CA0|nr:hypothetical protein OG623_19555 [Streptomyces sp. NBC_01012]
MKWTRRAAASITPVALAVTVTSCSSDSLAVPEKFCGHSVETSTLSPLLPASGSVKTRQDGEPEPGLNCELLVDNTKVLTSIIRAIDSPLPPEDWETALSLYDRAQKQTTSFHGVAVIGADGARVTAKCDESAPSKFLLFNIQLRKDHVKKTDEDIKDVEHFVNDFVPGMTKQLKCTS